MPAPVGEDGIAVAMFDEELVTLSQAAPAELELAARTLTWAKPGTSGAFARMKLETCSSMAAISPLPLTKTP